MSDFLSHIFTGLSLSSILLLVSLGLVFSFGLMNVINMAHGEFIMIGAYVTYVFQHSLASHLGGVDKGIWFILAFPAAFVITGALGAILEMGLIRFLYGRPLDTLLATWGVGLILQQFARSEFGASNVEVTAPSWINGAWTINPDLVLPYSRIGIIGLAAVTVGAIYFYLSKTLAGRRLRATMQNREMATCLGVASRRVDTGTFALGAGLAGIAGCALTLIGSIGPNLGMNYIVDAFIVVVLGGVGRLPGAILAALIIGVGNTYLELGTTASLGKALILAFVIAFLQWKPAGLAAIRGR